RPPRGSKLRPERSFEPRKGNAELGSAEMGRGGLGDDPGRVARARHVARARGELGAGKRRRRGDRRARLPTGPTRRRRPDRPRCRGCPSDQLLRRRFWPLPPSLCGARRLSLSRLLCRLSIWSFSPVSPLWLSRLSLSPVSPFWLSPLW